MHLRELNAKRFALGLSYHATQRAHKPAPARERLQTCVSTMKIGAPSFQATGTIENEGTVARDDAHE